MSTHVLGFRIRNYSGLTELSKCNLDTIEIATAYRFNALNKDVPGSLCLLCEDGRRAGVAQHLILLGAPDGKFCHVCHSGEEGGGGGRGLKVT